MKKILLLVKTMLLAAVISAQSIDTVNVSVTMKWGDWCVFTSYLNGASDTVETDFWRYYDAIIDTSTNLTNNKMVTVPVVPGKIVTKFYGIMKQLPYEEASNFGSGAQSPFTILQNISHPLIQAEYTIINARHQNEFQAHRRLGKRMSGRQNN